MAKPIIFIDFYKTINFDHFWRFLPEPEFHKAENWVFKHNTYFWGAWMRGEYISEEINEVVSKAIDIPYDRLWDAFVEGCSSSRIEDHYLQALKCLSKHYEIILVTDNMDSFDRFFLPNARVDEYFDAIINSYNSNQLKTDHNGKTRSRYQRMCIVR